MRTSGLALSRCLLVVVSVLGSSLLAEGVTRVWFSDTGPRTVQLTQFWQYDARYGWSHVPGTRGTFTLGSGSTEVAINAKGFRGPEIEYARDDRRRRIVVLGDSYVWGYGVDQKNVFTELLGTARPDVEVVNLGVSGYSTDQELLLYRDEGHKYGADVIMVVVADNDPPGNMLAEHYVVYGKPVFRLTHGELVLQNQPVARTAWWKRAVAGLAGHSYLLNIATRYLYLRDVAAAPAGGATPGAGAPAHSPSPPRAPFPRTPEDEVTLRLLLELRRTVSTLQPRAKLLVMFVDGMRGFSPELAALLTPHDIACLDLGEYFDSSDPSLHLPGDFHWNAAGHRRVAEIVQQHLDGLLNDSSVQF